MIRTHSRAPAAAAWSRRRSGGLPHANSVVEPGRNGDCRQNDTVYPGNVGSSHKGEEAMSDHHTKAAVMRNFKLSGQGIEIKYQNNELTLSGPKLPAENERKFPDAE